jgi:disulfide bond formation protein DsbB
MTLAVTTFLALLALLAAVAVVAVAVLAAVGRLSVVREHVGPAALWLAFTVAATATAGSLYLSEVAQFVPCTLCWYQRIAMYPLVILLGIAALRGDAGIRRYVAPLAAVGTAIAAYHVAVQRLPGLPSGACSLDAPCTLIYVERFGFVTIPVMALIGFVAILTLVVVVLRSDGRADAAERS